MITNTGNPDFVKGWFMAANNKPLPDNANKSLRDGYKSGKNVSEKTERK